MLSAAALFWFAFVAGGATQDELGSVFTEAISALFHLVFGGSGTKTLFKAGTGQVDPLIVRVLGLASVGVLALVIPLGVWRIWKSYRRNTLAISLGAVALLYPFTLVPRLTQAGSEISQRASEFVFAGIGFVAAVLFLHLTDSVGRRSRSSPGTDRDRACRARLRRRRDPRRVAGNPTAGTLRGRRRVTLDQPPGNGGGSVRRRTPAA